MEQAFEKYLKSNLSCDKVNEEMNKLSNYSLDRKVDEELFINSFINYCTKHFFNCLTKLNNYGTKFSANDVFKISHHILTCEDNDANSIYYKKIKLLYKTFFFLEFDISNDTNDFTFYKDFSKNMIEDYETYLYNIGISILDSKDSIPFIKILFSKETPKFLKNIILTCFEYTRSTKKNPLDFIELCIPCLNLTNLYYLTHVIYTELNYKFNQKNEISYIILENFIHNSSKSEVIIDDFDKNIINIKIEKKDENTNIPLNEEMSKYFNFPNEDGKQDNLNFFNENNLKENKKKFQDFLKIKNIQNVEKYNVLYDQFEKNNKSINAFSFPFLLKYNIIEKIDEHFFQIYNYGNIRIELFSYLLSKYIKQINKYLDASITNEEKIELLKNSGFYKLNKQYILLISINEDDEKVFNLKMNLGQKEKTSRNNNKNFEVLNIEESDCSISKYNSESEFFYSKDINNQEDLYNFGNYSYEKDIRAYIKNLIKENKQVYELPRLYFFLNYCIPISKNEFQFITNMQMKILKGNSIHQYGFSDLDFVLKNDSNEDIKIDAEYLPYKEEVFMAFPKEKINNNKKIILKKESIIFFEFKSSFPELFWKENFNYIYKKIKNFLEVYKKRHVYFKEYIQIYFVYDNMPEIYCIKEMKNYISKNFTKMFENFEFGIYYFSRTISLINNEQSITELRNNISTMKDELDKTKTFMNSIISLFDLIPNEEIKERLEKMKKEFTEKKVDNSKII